MPAKVNHLAVVKSDGLASTWLILEKLWPSLVASLKGIHVMSVQNFTEGKINNISLEDNKLPPTPRIEVGEGLFFYGSDTTKGSLSVRQTGKYGIVNLSLNPIPDSEAILLEMWSLLKSLEPIGVFAGEELELYSHHIEAIESHRLTPLALRLCEIAIIATNDAESTDNRGAERSMSGVHSKGILFCKGEHGFRSVTDKQS